MDRHRSNLIRAPHDHEIGRQATSMFFSFIAAVLRGGALVVPLLALVPACQTGKTAMSVEEAKKVTASFGGTAFVPPPRTINDILALLDREASESEVARRLRATADAAPPAGADRTRLAGFYLERGMAARWLGRAKQEVDDLRKAAEFGRISGLTRSQRSDITFNLAVAEQQFGNYRRAIDLMSEIAAGRDGWALHANNELTQIHAWGGDLDGASRSRTLGKSLIAQGVETTGWAPVRSAEMDWAVLEARGRSAEAEPYARQVIDALRAGGLEARFPGIVERHRSIIVLNLIRQNRLVEAEAEARDAVQASVLKTGKLSALTGKNVRLLALVLNEEGRHADAERLSAIAIEIYEQVGAGRGSFHLFARLTNAATLVSQQKWDHAIKAFEHVWEEMADNSFLRDRWFAARIDYPLALIKAGRPAEALQLLRPAVERRRSNYGDGHYSTAEARGVLGMALAALGNSETALEEFRAAIPVLLYRLPQAGEEGESVPARNQRLAMILEAYIMLLNEIRGSLLEKQSGIDVTAETFRVADAARLRTVSQALGASAARAAAGNPALADLVRRLQDADLEIRALQGGLANLASVPPDQRDAGLERDLRIRIERLGQARSTLAQEIERSFPDYAKLMEPRPATLQEAQASLRPGEAMIAFYVGADRTLVWAIPHTGGVAFALAPMGATELEAVVATLRKALDPGVRFLGDVPPFDVVLAHELYTALLEPVRAGWQNAKTLIIVPHGPLGQLPFALLPTAAVRLGPETAPLFARYRGVPWLVRRHAVASVPSASSLVTLRSQQPGAPTRRPFAGFGDPYFSPQQAERAARERARMEVVTTTQGTAIALRSFPKVEGIDRSQLNMLPRLPETAEEVMSIAQATGADVARDVFLGERANEQTVKTMNLSGYRVIAFATHGLLPRDLDGLTQPALALTAPEVAGIQGDGLLTMEEILGLRLDADWIALSACNTASGNGAGAEAVSGLGRAFFYAGARALLVTHWPVETTSAKVLVTDVFRRQAQQPEPSRAEALRQAMLRHLDGPGFVDRGSNRIVFSYAHPIFWAPFSLVGDTGGIE